MTEETPEKKHVIKATFYMKSGNSFTVDLSSLTMSSNRVTWMGAGNAHDNPQMHYVNIEQIEAVIYTNYKDWMVDSDGNS